ncbi:MAG: hypothetical protein KGM44_11165 [bacterium]|nr:hypothetical protein [bacterium]
MPAVRSKGWWTAAAVFGLVFFGLSLQDDVYNLSVNLIHQQGLLHVLPRKLMAVIAFAIVSYCVGMATRGPGQAAGWRNPVLCGTLFSAFIEVAQHIYQLHYDKQEESLYSSAFDVASGTLGGFLAWLALSRRPNRRR